jgi:hypothetical protein
VILWIHASRRPTKYKKQYCEEIIRFFDVPQTKIQKVTQITASGVTEFNKEVQRIYQPS